jgi:hypothetical protein
VIGAIYASMADGRYRKTLIKEKQFQPVDIVVNPELGLARFSHAKVSWDSTGCSLWVKSPASIYDHSHCLFTQPGIFIARVKPKQVKYIFGSDSK